MENKLKRLEWLLLFGHSEFAEMIMSLIILNASLWLIFSQEPVSNPFWFGVTQITSGMTLGLWLIWSLAIHIYGIASRKRWAWKLGCMMIMLTSQFIFWIGILSHINMTAILWGILAFGYTLVFLRSSNEGYDFE